MGLHKRTTLDKLLGDIEEGKHKQLYLCFGERYLCRKTAELIEQKLIERKGGTVHTIDGSTEDTSRILSRILSFSLLPGVQIYRISDSTLFLSKNIAVKIWEKALKAHQDNREKRAARHLMNLLVTASISSEGSSVFSDISPDQWHKLFSFSHPTTSLAWADRLIAGNTDTTALVQQDASERLLSAIDRGLPPDNIVVLTTENIDKRKKLFTGIKKSGEIIDCSITQGLSKSAVREQKEVLQEMVRNTLAPFKKSIEPRALELLFERVGFHPVGVVMEVEKLALFAEDRASITTGDVELMVARTREDAIFQLTEALGNRNITRSLVLLNNLISDGIHSLAVLASIRNYLRKLLIFRALQLKDDPIWSGNMNSNRFQNDYLPALKEKGEWSELLKGHPYALYMSFSKASEFSPAILKKSLSLILEAEFRLKGAPIPGTIVLEELLISLISAISTKQNCY